MEEIFTIQFILGLDSSFYNIKSIHAIDVFYLKKINIGCMTRELYEIVKGYNVKLQDVNVKISIKKSIIKYKILNAERDVAKFPLLFDVYNIALWCCLLRDELC